jgi:hypothetical protein
MRDVVQMWSGVGTANQKPRILLVLFSTFRLGKTDYTLFYRRSSKLWISHERDLVDNLG